MSTAGRCNGSGDKAAVVVIYNDCTVSAGIQRPTDVSLRASVAI